jgi:hypothetical protein
MALVHGQVSATTDRIPLLCSTTGVLQVGLVAGTAVIGQVSSGGITTSTGALTPTRIVTATSGVAKATAGRVYSSTFANTTAALRYMQLYNKATAGVPGTDTPLVMIPISPNNSIEWSPDAGVAFTTGIAWAITTDAAGATAATGGDVVGTLFWA